MHVGDQRVKQLSLGAEFRQNPVPNYLLILYVFVNINLTTLGS